MSNELKHSLIRLKENMSKEPVHNDGYEAEIQAGIKEKRNEYLNAVCDPLFAQKTWENYTIRDLNREKVSRVQKWLESGCMGSNDCPEWLVIYGNQGTGKTFLKNLIIKDLYDKHGIHVKSLTMYNLYMQYLDALNSGKLTKLFADLKRHKVLIIDELGRKQLTQAIYDFLFEIVDTIYLENKILVVISNLPPNSTPNKKGISDYLDTARIRENSIMIPLVGDSFR